MLYDYKSDELTQEVYVPCLCPIIEDLADEYSTLRRYNHLSIYAPSWLAREIVGRLLDEIEDLWVNEDSESELLQSEEDVIITIGYDGMIYIESARGVDGTIKRNEDCSLTYFYDELGRHDLEKLEKEAESILVFGFECEDEMCGCEEECDDETDEKSELSTTSTSEYYVNNKLVSKEEFDKKFAEFENEYMNNIRDMLLGYCDLMDKVNNWHRMIRF